MNTHDDWAVEATRVARGAVFLAVQSLLNHILSVIYFSIAARILSTDEIGVLSVLGMLASLAATFFTFAIPTAVTWHVSNSLKMGLSAAKHLVIKSVSVGLITAVLVTFSTNTLAKSLASILFGKALLSIYISLLSLDLFAVILTPFFACILIGLERYETVSFNNILSYLVRFGLSIILLLGGLGVSGVLYGWIIGDFLNLALHLTTSFRNFKCIDNISNYNNSNYNLLRLLQYSIPLYITNLLVYTTLYIDRYLLLALGELSYVAIFSVAMAAYTILGNIGDSISSALFPKLTKMYSNGADLTDALNRSSRHLFLLYIPLATGLATLARPVVLLIAGKAYEQAVLPLAILALTSGMTCFIRVVDPVLLAIGKTRIPLVSRSLATIGSILIFLLTVPVLGLVGAALARLALTLIYVSYSTLSLKQFVNIQFDKKAYLKAWVGSIVMSGIMIITALNIGDIYYLPVYVILGSFVYVVVLKALKAVSDDDVRFAKLLIPKHLKIIANILERFFI
jgi:O-antigen/teichoic acid export membrane protein